MFDDARIEFVAELRGLALPPTKFVALSATTRAVDVSADGSLLRVVVLLGPVPTQDEGLRTASAEAERVLTTIPLAYGEHVASVGKLRQGSFAFGERTNGVIREVCGETIVASVVVDATYTPAGVASATVAAVPLSAAAKDALEAFRGAMRQDDAVAKFLGLVAVAALAAKQSGSTSQDAIDAILLKADGTITASPKPLRNGKPPPGNPRETCFMAYRNELGHPEDRRVSTEQTRVAIERNLGRFTKIITAVLRLEFGVAP